MKFSTLSEGFKVTRRVFPNSCIRKLQEFNSTASSNRFLGACVSQIIIDELAASLASAHVGDIGSSNNGNDKFDNKVHADTPSKFDNFAFAVRELTKLTQMRITTSSPSLHIAR